MGTIMEASILHHVCIVLLLLWILNVFNYGHSFAYVLCFVYLYLVHSTYVLKLRKKVQYDEKRESNQRRVFSESETVRWLNYAIEKIWPLCMEEIVSQKMLLPIIPWFLQKYKPWTVRDVAIQQLYLGRSPPVFTDMRVVQKSQGDDHLVLELGMNFRTADDMSAILGVKLRKRLGFGMLAKLHLLGLHVEGKVLVGVKFLRGWPFISRLRVCFAEPPYFQMIVKPIFTHGIDVTELPGIAGWIDKLLALVFEQTLVEPNMLVVDVEKFVSPQEEKWFSIDAKEPIAYAVVEVLEASEMKPSDMNGLADPYVKGQLGPYRFRTKTQRKTLSPKWIEEFKIPICSWESQNSLAIEVCDKDPLFDDMLGVCCINIHEFRDGQRHDMWLPLQNVKMGRLRIAITVVSQGNRKEQDQDLSVVAEGPDGEKAASFADGSSRRDSFSSGPPPEKSQQRVGDKFEPIDVEGQSETGIWIQHPGSETAQVWESRKGKGRRLNTCDSSGSRKSPATQNESSSTDESIDSNRSHSKNPVLKGLRKLGSAFHRSPRRGDDKSPREDDPFPRRAQDGVTMQHHNIRSSSNAKESGVKLVMEESVVGSTSPGAMKDNEDLSEEREQGHHSPSERRGHVRDAAKNILKQAGKSVHGLKTVFTKTGSRKSKGEVPDEEDSDDDDDDSFSSSRD
ncbi:hypothetical protein M569_02542, partial [Genlisea aurea]